MTKILEVNEDGALVIPAELLSGAKPHQRYTAESTGKNLLLRPESDSRPVLPRAMSGKEFVARFSGLIPPKDVIAMEKAIEEAFEHIEADERSLPS